MNTRHSSKISRTAAELLLDGSAGADHARSGDDLDQLARVLAAATAPARDGELAGEQMAVAAFEAARLAPLATPQPQKEQKTMLGKILTAKILFSSVAALATGGVALAASTGALTGSNSAHVSASASASASASVAAPAPSSTPISKPSAAPKPSQSSAASTGTGTGIVPATPVESPSPSASASHTPLPQTAAALCNTLIGDVAGVSGGTLSQTGQVQALSSSRLPTVLKNPEFNPLISTAQSVSTVSDYCALLLDLPDVPDPSALASLPGTVLGQLLTALPASTLAGILTSLPTSVLGSVLTSLPTSSLSSVLNMLPTSTVSQLLKSLPTSVLTQLPTSVLSGLPQSVLSSLPTGLLSGLGL